MMAEARTDIVIPDDLITCPICFEIFKSPKSLPCLHTFCKGCLHAYVSKAEENKTKVTCPVCRTHVTNFTGQDIDLWLEYLPANFMVNSLIEREKIETGKKNCEVCEHYGKSTTATMWCKECSEGYCKECSEGHKTYKTLRKHNLIPLKEISKFGLFCIDECALDCSVHKNRKIELFCFDHKQPCCLTCMTVDHRKCDKVMTLEEASENFRNDPTFVSFTKRITELTSKMREEVTDHEEMRKHFASQLFQIRDQGRRTKEEMIERIEIIYKKFEDDISTITKQHEADDQSEILKQKMTQLQLFTRTFDTLKSATSDLTLFLEFHKMKGKLKEIEDFLDDHRSNRKQESVEFLCNENVRHFHSVVSSLGEVRVIDSFAHAQASVSAKIDYTTCALKEVVTIEGERGRFTDALLITSDTIIAVGDDGHNAVFAYNTNGSLLSSSDLPCRPWALSVVDTNQVVVTLRDKRSLQFFTYIGYSKTFSKGKTINLNEIPWAINYAENCLFVTFAQKVKQFNLAGTIIHEINIPDSSNALYGISHVNGNMIVGDHGYRAKYDIHVVKLDSRPDVKHQKKDSCIDRPLGVDTDCGGNIYVAGWGSNNVIQLSPSGDVIREILPSTSGFQKPMGINISHDGKKFILTHNNKITIYEFL